MKNNGGQGYAKTLTVFVPKLKAAGASDEVLRTRSWWTIRAASSRSCRRRRERSQVHRVHRCTRCTCAVAR